MDCSQVNCRLHRQQYSQAALAALIEHPEFLATVPPSLDPYLDWTQLQQLFNITAFWARDRSIEALRNAVLNSNPVVSAMDGDRLIGFARATSDGVYRATIWDVVVHPDYQGAGIGRKLVETILMHPTVNQVERVYLMTTHKQKFYERIGFEVNTTTTMVLYDQPLEPVPVSAETLQHSQIS